VFIGGHGLRTSACSHIRDGREIKVSMLKESTKYALFWFHHKYEVMVTNKCKLSFNIENYKDELLCDVILMNAYHLLLGRPW
jgi:hypothetical protein